MSKRTDGHLVQGPPSPAMCRVGSLLTVLNSLWTVSSTRAAQFGVSLCDLTGDPTPILAPLPDSMADVAVLVLAVPVMWLGE